MGHTLRGAATAWLGLIAFQVLVANAGQASGAVASINTMLQRLLSPDVPAIPDRRNAGFYDADGNYHPNIPGYLGGGTTTAPGSGSAGNPNFRVADPAPTTTTNPQYANPNPNQPGGVWE